MRAGGIGFCAAVGLVVSCAAFEGASDDPGGDVLADGGVVDDGALDATRASDGGPGPESGARWCEGRTTPGALCFDFDGDGPIEEGWSKPEILEGATLTGAPGWSGTGRVLHVDLPASVGNPRAKLVLTLPSAHRVLLSFDVRLEQAGSACDSAAGCWGSLAEITRGAEILSVYAKSGEAMVQAVGSSPTKDVTLAPFASSTTTRIQVEADFDEGKFRVLRDAEVIGSEAMTTGAGESVVALGIGQTNGSNDAWAVSYDNVLIETH